MKTTLKKFPIPFLSIIITCLCLSFAPSTASAQAFPGDLRLLSTIQGKPVFQLNLYNGEPAKYSLRVKDAFGNVLYSTKLEGVNLTGKYMLDIDEADYFDPSFAIRFELTDAGSGEKKVYTVKRNDRVIKDLSIAKL